MMMFLVLGGCILGAILLLIFVLRALCNKAGGVKKNPSEVEERLVSPTISSEYERPTVSVPVEESTICLEVPITKEEAWKCQEVPITEEEGWWRKEAQEECQEAPIAKEAQEESSLKNQYYAVDEFVLDDDSD